MHSRLRRSLEGKNKREGEKSMREMERKCRIWQMSKKDALMLDVANFFYQGDEIGFMIVGVFSIAPPAKKKMQQRPLFAFEPPTFAATAVAPTSRDFRQQEGSTYTTSGLCWLFVAALAFGLWVFVEESSGNPAGAAPKPAPQSPFLPLGVRATVEPRVKQEGLKLREDLLHRLSF